VATINAGIIGCGGIARRHAAAYTNLAQATLVAVCDAIGTRREPEWTLEQPHAPLNGGWASVTEQPEGRVGLNDVWEIPGEEDEAHGTVNGENHGR
jgi:hypothetical protein